MAFGQFLTQGQFVNYGARVAFTQSTFGYVTGGSGTWVEAAQVTIQVANPGKVVVTASGMIVGLDGNDVTLSLNTISAARGPWVYSTSGRLSGDPYDTYGITRVFDAPTAGSYTFYINATSYAGDGTSISIENGALVAAYYSNYFADGAAAPDAAPDGDGASN